MSTMPTGRFNGSNRNSPISQRVDSLLAECRRRGAAPTMREVEGLYTDGCAEVLMREAEQLRVRRRLAAARADACTDAPSTAEVETLAQRADAVVSELAAVRADLRQLRAALEWAQSGAAIKQSIDFDSVASSNGAARR